LTYIVTVTIFFRVFNTTLILVIKLVPDA